MRDVFLFSFHAVGPIVLILALGYFVRRVGPWKDDFYDALNKLCFHVFLPIQLFLSSYNIESICSLNMRAITYIVCSIPAAIAAFSSHPLSQRTPGSAPRWFRHAIARIWRRSDFRSPQRSAAQMRKALLR